MSDITAIIPLDLSHRPKDIIYKAVRLAAAAEKANFPLVFGLNDQNRKHDNSLKEQLGQFTTTRVVTKKLHYDLVNMSALRNIAFTAVNSNHLVLLDVDIWPDFTLFEKYKHKIIQGRRPYFFLPCIYLTGFGSSRLISQADDPDSLTDKYFSFSRKEFLHLASPSSITVMKSLDYTALEGFDERYSGHGFEDFDFMLRLADRYDEVGIAPDFLNKQSDRSPLFAVGFKRELGRVCIEPLFEKDFTYHLYHPKAPKSSFYTARPDNFRIFSTLHSSFLGGQERQDPTLITEFLAHCRERGKNISDYSILFENKPGHIDRFDTFRRRLRFLLNE